jgi:dihydroorotate dehydrogenase
MTLRHPPLRILRPILRPIPRQPTPGARHASTSSNPASNRLRNFVYGSSAVALLSLGFVYVTDTRASVHKFVAPRLIRLLYPDAEDAHHAGTYLLKELYTLGLYPRERGVGDSDLRLVSDIFGQVLSNPIGISGGLDKHADIPDALFALGAGVVEIGGVTPLPQDGNPKPRVFRLASQNALINRYGLNSEGADVVAMRLRQRVREYAYQQGYGIDEEAERMVLDGEAGVPPGSLIPGRLLAVQIAKNKLTPESDLDAVVWDHVYCVDRLGKYADIIVVNVSSPNTPGLRGLQSKGPLTQILTAVVDAANAVPRKNKPVVMVKVSPDEDSESQIQGICDAVWESGVAGVVVGNTTMKRPDPLPRGYILPEKEARSLLEFGGYSGPQLFDRTLNLVGKYRKILDQGPVEIGEPPSSKSETLPSKESEQSSVVSQIEASVKRDEANLKPLSVESATERDNSGQDVEIGTNIPPSSEEAQQLFRLPERNDPFSTSSSPDDIAASAPVAISTQSASLSTSTPTSRKLANVQPKIIFASGGITNGDQALHVLQAGASVAMCYTAVVYGGVGTVGRIKDEIKELGNKR